MGGGCCCMRKNGGSSSLSFTLHTEYYQRKFIASNLCTWAYLFHVFVLITLFVLPFVLTFSAGNFWSKIDMQVEQPRVTYTEQLYGELIFRDTSTGMTDTYQYSTVKAVRDQIGGSSLLNQPTVRVSQADIDRDGLPDRWNVSLRVRKPDITNELAGGTIVLSFDYQLSQVVQVTMETLALIDFGSLPSGVQSVKTVGNLQLRQQSPIKVTRAPRTLYNDALFSYLENESLDRFISQRYLQRNDTTAYIYEQYLQKGGQSSYVDVSIVIDIPRQQQIIYSPDVYETLKFAWIQYYSFLILIYAFLYRLFYGFVVKNKVFDSVELSQVNLSTLVNEKKKCL